MMKLLHQKILQNALLLTMFFISTVTWSQLATWNPNNVDSTLDTFNPTTVAANTTVTGLVRGPGINSASLADGWGGQNHTLNATTATAISDGDYYTFTAKANNGYKMNITGLSNWKVRRSGTGPTNIQLQYKIDNAAYTTIGATGTIGSGSSGVSVTDFAAFSTTVRTALTDIPSTSTVTFRIIVYGATNTGGNMYITYGTSIALALSGSVVSSAVAPTITGNATQSFTYGTGGNYSYTTAGSPTPTITAKLTSGDDLPTGLTLNTTNSRLEVSNSLPAGTYNVRISAAGSTTVTKDVILTVNKANQSIIFADITKNFGDPDFSLTATGGASGEPVTYTSSNLAVATISGSTVTIIGAGNTLITASQAGNANYNDATDVPRTLLVNKAAQNITFSDITKTYGDAGFTLSATGGASGQTITYISSNTSVATIAGNTVTIVAPGNSNITASQQGNNNYNAATDVTHALTVNVKPITITGASAENKIYDATNAATLSGLAALTASEIVDTDDVALDTYSASFATINVANGINVNAVYTLNGAQASRYILTQPVNLSANITAKEITISGILINDKVFDNTTAATISGTPTLTGVLNSEDVTLNAVGATAEFTSSAVGSSIPVNVTGYVLAGSDIANYTLQQPQGLTANITSPSLQNQAITFNALNAVTYGDNDFNLNATSNSGLTITYTSSDTSVATVTGNTVTIVAPGTTTITASQTGNSTYNPAPAVPQELVVNQKNLTVTNATVTDKVYDKTSTAVVTGTLTGVVGSDAVTLISSGTFANDDAGTGISVIPNYSISGTDIAKYTLTQPILTGNILPAALTINSAVASNKPFDGTASATITGTLSGIYTGDVATLNGTGTFTTVNVANGIAVTSTATLSGADAANYVITQPTGLTANITAVTITVNAVAENKVYDRTADATITISLINGLVSGQNVTVTGNGSFVNGNVGSAKPVTANLLLSGPNSSNYTLIQPTGLSANITEKTLTVDTTNITVATKIYDGTSTATLSNTILNGIVSGDEANVNVVTATFSQVTPGTGIIVSNVVLSGSAAGNYNLTQPGTLTGTIAQKELTIIGTYGQNKVYNGTDDATFGGVLFGIVGTDVVTANFTGTYASADVANGITINSTATLGGANANYYTLAQPTGITGNITPKTISVTAVAQNKIYDKTITATVANGQLTASDIITGDDVTVAAASVTGSFDNANVGNNKNVTALFALQGTDAANYRVVQQTFQANITPLALTADITSATVTTRQYSNTNAAVLQGVVLIGVLTGDTVNAVSGTFTSAIPGQNIPVNIAISGGSASNYTITQPIPALTGTITKKLLTITAADKNKLQGTANPTLTFTASGFISGESAANAQGYVAPTIATTATTTSAIGAYPIILMGGAADYYDITLVNGWLFVNEPVNIVFNPGTLWSNDIQGPNPNTDNPYTTGQDVVAGAYITVSGVGRGSGVTGQNTNNRYNASSWNSVFDTDDHFTFTITPKAGYAVNFTNFVYTAQASGTGPTTAEVRSSKDNYNTNIGTASTGGATIALNGASYQNVTEAITFRVYGYGGSASGGTFSINDFSFNGSVQEVPVRTAPQITSLLTDSSVIESTDTYQITATGTPVVTLTATNLPTGATVNNSGLVTLDGTTPAGVYNITLTATSYYGTTSKTLIYTVTKKDQALAFNPDPIPNKFLSDTAFQVVVTNSAPLTVTLSSSDTAVATIAQNGTITITGIGTTTITASNTGNTIYNAVSVTRTFTVLPDPVITATPLSMSFTAIQGQGPSAATQISSITASHLVPASGNITLTASTGFEVAMGIGAYGQTGTFTYSAGSVNQTNPQIFVRFAAGSTQGNYTGTLTISGGSASFVLPLSATVELAPAITTIVASFGDYCFGTQNTISLAYTTQGTFPAGNFYVQHSNATGVFPADFSNIISLAANASPLSATLPSTLSGGNYRVRVIHLSSAPAITSSTNDNGSNIVIHETPAPAASANTFCTAATVAQLTATGTDLKWYAAATGGSALVSTTALATGSYYVSQTLNTCESTRTQVSVTVNVTPAPAASANIFCTAATVAQLTATGTDLKWYAAATGGSALASTTALATGNYYVSQTLNTCESTRTQVSVTVNVTPAPAASANIFCTAATVAQLTATGTDLKWYAAATGGSALVSTTALATGSYYVSQTLNTCESTRTQVSVTVNVTPAPAAPAASANTFCTAATVAQLTATGTDLKWYAAATGGSALASTTALATGNYYVSQTLNTCESTRTQVSVTVNVTPAPAASANTFCTAATVAQLTATGTDLKWYAAATGGSALASTTALATGSYYVSQTLNTCESTRTQVSVTVNVTPAPAASANTFCTAATVAQLTATGTDLKWYAAATGGSALASTTALATGNYYVSQTLNTCESTRTQVSVTVNVTPAPAASANTFCNAATVAQLTATGTDLKWYIAATGGSALASTTALATGSYYVSQTLNTCESTRTQVSVTVNVTPAPAAPANTFCTAATVAQLTATGTDLKWYAAATGGSALASTTTLATDSYYVSQTLNTCESTRTQVSVTVNVTPSPAAPASSANTFCTAATVAQLTATGTDLKWYAAATGGSALVSTTALATGSYYVSQTLNTCESTRTQVSVTVNVTPAPAAPAASANTFCTAATVAQLTATGTDLKWYAAATGGSALASTTALATGNYYVSQTLNTCESTRTQVSVTVNVTPAPAASANTFCTAATVAQLTATGTDLKWYAAATGGSTLASTTALATGSYYVSQTLNTCESTRTQVSVTVNVTPAPAALANTFCTAATVAQLTATGTDLKWYAAATGGSALASTTALATGNYYVSQTLNTCESTRTQVSVTVNVTPAPAASANTFCTAATVAQLTATGTDLKWYAAATGGSALVSTTALATGSYYVSQTLNTCESTRAQVSVTVNVTPAPAASANTFCTAATVAQLTATGTDLKWYAAATGGSALASTTTLATDSYYVSQTLNTCESTRTQVSVTVNVTPSPAAPASSANTFCTAATVAQLTATGTDLKWYAAATGGSALASTTALATGNYYVSQTLNTCESTRTQVSVTVNVTPAPAASANTFCTAATVAQLTATGTDLKWYAAATGGSALASTTALATGNYYVSQTLNTCESTRTQVSVMVNVTPAPPVAAQTFTTGATVAQLMATGTDIKWYSAATGGAPLISATVLVSGNYYASQTVDGCESTRTLVMVTITNPIPAAPMAQNQRLCVSSTVIDLDAQGENIKWYATATGGSALADTTVLANTSYFASQTVNGFESARTEVTVTLSVTPVPTADQTITFCHAATVAQLTANGANLKWYTSATGGNSLDSSFNLVTANYYVSQTVNGCESTRTVVVVIVTSTPQPTATNQTFCSGATVQDYIDTTLGLNIKVYASSNGTDEMEDEALLSTGTYYVSQTANGCESSRKEVVVTINVTPAPEGETQQQFTVEGTTIANLVAEGLNIKWYASEADALAGINALESSAPLTSGTTYYATQTINGCESKEVLAVTVEIVLGKDEFNKFTFQYYPNPVINELAITAEQTITNVRVYSLAGQELMNQNWNTTNGKIDMDALEASVYIVKVSFGKTEKVIKVVKKKE